MTKANIIRWIGYWTRANMFSFDEIKSLADVALARKFCPEMNVGVFYGVTDAQLWEAITETRGPLVRAA